MPGSLISPFIRTDQRSPEYQQAYRAGVRAALAWLNERANECRDNGRRNLIGRLAREMGEEAKAISRDEVRWIVEERTGVGNTIMADKFLEALKAHAKQAKGETP